MALVFNMGSQAQLDVAIEDTDVRIKLTNYEFMLAKGGSGDSYYAQMIDAEGNREIVIVDVGNSNVDDGLSVTRGAEGTAARDWGRGTIIWQVLSKASWETIEQVSAARQVAFVPDGVLVSNYLGEKVYQTDLRLWWKAVAAAVTEWRLIAGIFYTADVVFSPPPGGVPSGSTLSMSSATPGANIYYTTDGTDPDETDTLYTAPILIPDPGPTTFKARAFGTERWQSPSQNITTGVYSIVTPTLWANKSMAVGNSNSLEYSANDTILLLASEGEVYQRIGFVWTSVISQLTVSDTTYDFIEDGSDLYQSVISSAQAKILQSDSNTYPAWTQLIQEGNLTESGTIDRFDHVVPFGGNIYLTLRSTNPALTKHGLWIISATDNITLITRFASGDTDVTRVRRPINFGGTLYTTVEAGAAGWVGNLLVLSGAIATRQVTVNRDTFGLFEYNSELHFWSNASGPNRVQIWKWDGASNYTLVKEAAHTSQPSFIDHTVRVGNLFYTIEAFRGQMWRWDPIGDTLVIVAGSIADFSSALTKQLAWDQSDVPASMYMVMGSGSNKTFRWE